MFCCRTQKEQKHFVKTTRIFFGWMLKQDDRRQLELLVDTLLVCAVSSHMLLSLARQALSAGLWSLHFCMGVRTHTHTHNLRPFALHSLSSYLFSVYPQHCAPVSFLSRSLAVSFSPFKGQVGLTEREQDQSNSKRYWNQASRWQVHFVEAGPSFGNVERRNTKSCIHS